MLWNLKARFGVSSRGSNYKVVAVTEVTYEHDLHGPTGQTF